MSTGSGLKAYRTDGVGGNGIILVPNDEVYSSVVVWMHGLGDTADGWASLMPMLDLKETKFILPTANERPITLNGGYVMPGWADVYGLDDRSNEDEDGFHESASRVQKIIDLETETNGISTERIVIGGFSQGGALALHVALRAQYKLAGVAALSTWLPLRSQYPQVLSEEAKQNLKLFQAHGEADEVVKLHWGHSSNQLLKEWLGKGKSSESKHDFQFMKIPNMGHSSDQAEIDALKQVLKSWLS